MLVDSFINFVNISNLHQQVQTPAARKMGMLPIKELFQKVGLDFQNLNNPSILKFIKKGQMFFTNFEL